ncbi:MAG: hypothetical protein IKD72_02700 [Clostridia bacterium]|nr:hypothetical protein [Clostridia bacterium]
MEISGCAISCAAFRRLPQPVFDPAGEIPMIPPAGLLFAAFADIKNSKI